MSRRERSRGNNDDNYNNNDDNDDNEPIELELRGSKIVYFSNGIDILDPILFLASLHTRWISIVTPTTTTTMIMVSTTTIW